MLAHTHKQTLSTDYKATGDDESTHNRRHRDDTYQHRLRKDGGPTADAKNATSWRAASAAARRVCQIKRRRANRTSHARPYTQVNIRVVHKTCALLANSQTWSPAAADAAGASKKHSHRPSKRLNHTTTTTRHQTPHHHITIGIISPHDDDDNDSQRFER